MKTLTELYDNLMEIDYQQETYGNVRNYEFRRQQIVEAIQLRESLEEEAPCDYLW